MPRDWPWISATHCSSKTDLQDAADAAVFGAIASSSTGVKRALLMSGDGEVTLSEQDVMVLFQREKIAMLYTTQFPLPEIRNHFVPSHQKHTALATHIHRIRAMAQWKAVTGAAA